jgi:N-acetyl-gamma-glutamylphosphate reductase
VTSRPAVHAAPGADDPWHALHPVRAPDQGYRQRRPAGLFEEAYKDEPFVDVLPFGSHPETRTTRASNMLRLAASSGQWRTVVVLVVQDNLVKGARSGRAVHEPDVWTG